MFSGGREIAPDPTEHVGSKGRPKASRDFLLDLGHADVVLGKIVRKRDVFVRREPEYIVLEVYEPFKEISGF